MNYVISIVTPEALPRLEELTKELGLPLNVTLLGPGTPLKSVPVIVSLNSFDRPSRRASAPHVTKVTT